MDPSPRHSLLSTADLLLAGGWLLWLGARLPELWWPLEVLGNFPVQLTLGGAVLVALFAALRDLPRLGLSVGLVAAAGWPLLSWQDSARPAPTSGSEPLVLSLHNVLRTNPTPGRLIDELEHWQPDLAVLQEVSPAWSASLSRLDPHWPTSLLQPADHNFGIAAYARQPWQSAEVLYWCSPPADELPALDLRLTHAGRPLRVLAVHVFPPVSAAAAAFRREQVDGVVRELRAHPELPTVVIGDLNTTMFAHTYRDLRARTGLRDARSGWGLLTSWPAALPSWARLSLDHVLVSEELRVTDLQLGEPTGSDHRGLRVALQWR